MGNLTRDPELRVTPKGTAICQFSIAINRDWKNDAGEKQTEVTYVDCEAWSKTGETIAKYLTKGRPIFVEGRLKLDQWEDKKSGEKRSRMKILVENFQFLGSKDDGGQHSSAQAPEPTSARPPARATSAPSAGISRGTPVQENLDDDVPF